MHNPLITIINKNLQFNLVHSMNYVGGLYYSHIRHLLNEFKKMYFCL